VPHQNDVLLATGSGQCVLYLAAAGTQLPQPAEHGVGGAQYASSLLSRKLGSSHYRRISMRIAGVVILPLIVIGVASGAYGKKGGQEQFPATLAP